MVRYELESKKARILDRRVFFVADRVVISQIIMFLFSGFLTSLIEIDPYINSLFVTTFWWILLIPLFAFIALYAFREEFYFFFHWHGSLAGRQGKVPGR